MNCNVCGSEIPVGSPTCPVCGAPAQGAPQAPQDAYGAQGGYVDPNQGGYVDPNMQYNADPYAQQAAVPQQKSNKGLIIGIAIGVGVLVCVLVLWMLGVFGGGDHDGTYKLSRASAMGMELSGDQLESFGMDPDDYTIKISGSSATVDMAGQVASCKVKFSGDKVTFSGDGQELEGTFKSGEITLSYMGVDMVFAK